MRLVVLCSFAVAALMPLASFAEGPSCTAAATEKKLAGAAKNSFMKKCERDAAAVCTTNAADKKLAGAAKNSFTKKCTRDAVG
ncbi:PsiF family protein [Hydrogenophaga sp.]|uniref:PsiF family protein n=1 Tax=Hydrogenophaga sp. TaxID=1904254 RepID=UPI002717271C|nr:PsiF family protein [Hydrogenophaga sp.]MDO9434921.1 PsiF family protein [Hydrogenophaga sp.]